MFWRMAGLSPASPVENILDKENFSLDDLLDEDEIIQECKALNGRLINFLREKTNIRQLILYIVEEAPDDTDTQKIFKFPFVACEIFTCEVDIILKALVEDEELMDELFSFLHPERSHSTLLAGYFSKVVVCLLLRKTTPLMNYIRAHQDIVGRLVDLIGITSIMEVLIRLIGSDEHVYTDSTQWLEDMNVLEMIVDKFSSSDSPEVHANAAETLCAITRNSPPGLASKISSPSFIERLFHHALEDSRPKSVLVNSLSVCISLLDPKRLTPGTYFMYTRQMDHVSRSPVNPETVQGMLESLGDLLKLLDISSEEHVLLTTYGKLKPPLGKHRLKIIEFISVLVGVSSEAAEKELIRLGAVKRIIELFFEYPYNNFLHHHVEHILTSCLESKNSEFIEHVLHDCNLIGRMIEAEKNSTLAADTNKPTIPAEGKPAPRIGNIGHITCIANKLVQLANSNNVMHTFLQDNADWVDWQTNVLLKRNTLENVSQWACGRPTALQDRTRDSDDDDYQDRDFDVAALANNLSQAFRFGIYSNDEIDEARGSLERDDEDVYFDEESAEVVISSLRLGDDQESGSLFTNSNWFAFEDERIADEHLSGPVASPSPKVELHEIVEGSDEEALADTATSEIIEPEPTSDDNVLSKSSEDVRETETNDSDKPSESTDTRGNSDSAELPPTSISTDTSTAAQHPPLPLPNGGLQGQPDDKHPDQMVPPPATVDNSKLDSEVVPDPKPIDSGTISPSSVEVSNEDPSSVKPVPQAGTEGCSDTAEHEEEKK